MTVAVSSCPVGLYAPAQDNSVSPAGDELRSGLVGALVPPRPSRTTLLFEKINAALRKGTATEGVLVKVEPFGRMCDVLAALPEDVPLPDIVVESASAIGLDWTEGPRRALTLTIDESPYIGVAALLGHEPLHGRMPFTGALPQTLDYLFHRLYPSPEV
jgi:hypothetical protein